MICGETPKDHLVFRYFRNYPWLTPKEREKWEQIDHIITQIADVTDKRGQFYHRIAQIRQITSGQWVANRIWGNSKIMGIIWGNEDKCRGISKFLFTHCLESLDVVASSDTEPL